MRCDQTQTDSFSFAVCGKMRCDHTRTHFLFLNYLEDGWWGGGGVGRADGQAGVMIGVRGKAEAVR